MPVRGLKLLVVVMSVMILGGIAILIATLAGRLPRPHPGGTAPTTFTAAPLDLPAGARVEAISTGTDRLVIDLALPDGNRRLLILDLATGRELGAIPLRTAH